MIAPINVAGRTMVLSEQRAGDRVILLAEVTAGGVSASSTANQQGVAGEHTPIDAETGSIRRVSRRVEHLQSQIAHRHRLRMLQELEGGERSVSGKAESVESTQSNVSKHLKVLQDTGLVKRRQQGNGLLFDCG
jgi:hypothetical protein